VFKYNFISQLGVFLSILVLASACAGGEIGDIVGAPGPGPGYDDINDGIGETPSDIDGIGETPSDIVPDGPTACPGASPDVSASDGWVSSEASLPAFDGLYFQFKARPTAANLDGLLAVGAEDINDFAKAAIAVRFAEDGLVDVRDGSVYSSDVSYAYDAGAWYTVAVSADITTETYDVEIGRCGEPRETLIKGASFRYDANVSDQLRTWAVWSSQAAPLELSTPTWMTSGGCAPATCQSLGQECGQPSDGCGGSLDCGGCGSGEACASGLCVDNSTPPPEPTPRSAPTPPPGDGERPWAHNTGPTTPESLTPAGYTVISTPGAVVEGYDFSDTVTIAANNVTLRNFRITGGLYGIRVNAGTTGFVAEDGEIIGSSSAGIYANGQITARRLHIHDHQADGMKIEGSNSLIEACFIEKLGMVAGAHADGNQSYAGNNITFRGNNFWMPHPGTPNFPGGSYKSNSAHIIKGSSQNFYIDGNWMNGGAYTMYCTSPNTHVTNNFFGRDFNFGTRNGTCAEWTNNRFEDNGELIP